MDSVATYHKDGRTLTIFHDYDATSPREDDNVATLALFHRRNGLANESDFNTKAYNSWMEMEEAILSGEKVLAIKPVYMYDHSAIALSTKPFSCPWDSGQVGFAFITESRAKEMGISTDEENLDKIIGAEVDQYSYWLSGDTYGYKVVEPDGSEDGCWGFYGSNWKENGIFDNAEWM